MWNIIYTNINSFRICVRRCKIGTSSMSWSLTPNLSFLLFRDHSCSHPLRPRRTTWWKFHYLIFLDVIFLIVNNQNVTSLHKTLACQIAECCKKYTYSNFHKSIESLSSLIVTKYCYHKIYSSLFDRGKLFSLCLNQSLLPHNIYLSPW